MVTQQLTVIAHLRALNGHIVAGAVDIDEQILVGEQTDDNELRTVSLAGTKKVEGDRSFNWGFQDHSPPAFLHRMCPRRHASPSCIQSRNTSYRPSKGLEPGNNTTASTVNSTSATGLRTSSL